ncbi:5'-methylthioadenosine/adenosylhomocysteine nucleosidase [Neptunicella marina]|uniref:5'-methylthioadenosine/S-adenosylhomocysteine nucleosidase n=1 Tax=Neptunicella marina TaxID=2125989 RepID=A0A8J6LWG9_9ALTE|nr:5'-methylthioadenosine/adenosylhomocysteine nucleosidase [Neptunicella marina]MBC3765189.1 5'-methylthioadenosine/adenosylhomocysteine nucleosidase [Neptunicella marina]
MKIGILGAMDQEVELLQQSLSELEVIQWAHLSFYCGKLHGVGVVVVKCGIGKVAAAVATAELIDRFSPDYVVNTGSAGGFDSELNIGDLVIGTEVKHHDVDLTHFGYEPGQCAGMPAAYQSDERLVVAAEQATVKQQGIKSKRGLICTGDSFIGSDEVAARLRELFPQMAACEMEGAAIAQTCHMLDTPFVIIRSLSDIAGKTSSMSFNQYIEIAAKHSAELVINMIDILAD